MRASIQRRRNQVVKGCEKGAGAGFDFCQVIHGSVGLQQDESLRPRDFLPDLDARLRGTLAEGSAVLTQNGLAAKCGVAPDLNEYQYPCGVHLHIASRRTANDEHEHGEGQKCENVRAVLVRTALTGLGIHELRFPVENREVEL